MARVREFVRATLEAAVQLRAATALLVAVSVTAAVALPMAIKAWDARRDARARIEVTPLGVLVDTTDGDPTLLDGTTLDGDVQISFGEDGLVAVAYRLLDPEGTAVLEGADQRGPTFDLVRSDNGQPTPLPTSDLRNGDYTLAATLSFTDGRVERRAASFAVDNDG